MVAAAAGSAVAANALGQSPAPAAATHDFAKEARDNLQRNADTLSKFEIPVSTEPAFRFQA